MLCIVGYSTQEIFRISTTGIFWVLHATFWPHQCLLVLSAWIVGGFKQPQFVDFRLPAHLSLQLRTFC